ncbi:putative FmtA-like protein FLP [Coleophoma cylindrospora]|uniref:Putative FmtA-like protein FLP n=1 Tax=Coleophoma cylindrospora TaxID=1849047 RepID=A0A3D8RAE3_9HELO|nr:putative FmtA-like protein FLP [Coleophoma cylindrospora]
MGTTARNFIFLLLVGRISARCYDPSPAFPLPKLDSYREASKFEHVLVGLKESLEELTLPAEYDTSSFSVEITSSHGTLWETHHTARDKNTSRPGAATVDGTSVYRMASVTKAFTTLAIIQQHIAGNLSLDDPIDQYLPRLGGEIPWKDITLRTVASQLSGIPREFTQADVINEFSNPLVLGLPPVDEKAEGVPQCDVYYAYDRPCNEDDLYKDLATKKPIWPPKQKSTYSNYNFDLLGLVIEKVSGLSYTEYVKSRILQPLNMTSSSFVKSSDSTAVLPKGGTYWDVDKGIQRPTGGLYSSTSDMSSFLRYVLKNYNGLTPQLNWFNPGSYSTTRSSFYGMPWEIFRTDCILSETSRPIIFVTKGGSHPGYYSSVIMLPEYDLGITILTAGSRSLKAKIIEAVTVALVQAAEDVAQSNLKYRYTGEYLSPSKDLNSSLVLAHSDAKSLYIESFVSNSTDVIAAWQNLTGLEENFRVQLVPTLLYRDEQNQRGEIWRGLIVPQNRNPGLVWDDFCLTDEDSDYYARKPLFEMVFWEAQPGGKIVDHVDISAFRVRLDRKHTEHVSSEEAADGASLKGAQMGNYGDGDQVVLNH